MMPLHSARRGLPALLALSLFVGSTAAQARKTDLTPKTFPDLHALIRPHAQEWRHLRVHWLTDVVAARRRAAAQDRPIVICYTGGAGYNEPLGVC